MTIRVIAEAGTCAGSVEWAHHAVEAAAECGVWGFKVQILSADTIAAPNSPRYDRLAGPATQYEAFTDQIPREAWGEIQAHCQQLGLEFFASVWDYPAIELCESLGVVYYKIGSAEITNLPFIKKLAETKKTLMLSTGAATLDEVDEAIAAIDSVAEVELILMACTLAYPCEPEDAFLGRLVLLRADPVWERRVSAWGYSDHTTLTDISAIAVGMGASYLEKHFTITPGKGGDHNFGLNPFQMADYVDFANRAYRLMWPAHTSIVLPSEIPARQLARRGLHALRFIPSGQMVIIGHNAGWLRPVDGAIEPNEMWSGALVASVDLQPGAPVRWEDLRVENHYQAPEI